MHMGLTIFGTYPPPFSSVLQRERVTGSITSNDTSSTIGGKSTSPADVALLVLLSLKTGHNDSHDHTLALRTNALFVGLRSPSRDSWTTSITYDTVLRATLKRFIQLDPSKSSQSQHTLTCMLQLFPSSQYCWT